MKDYIYLDEELLNSNLAQLQEGLPTSSQVESETGSVRHSDTEKAVSKGLNNLLGFGSEYIKQNTELDGFEMTSSQREVLDSVFHDYAVDLLLDSIPEYENLVTSIDNAEEGNYIFIKDYFNIYDFDHLSKTLDMDKLKPIMSGQETIELNELRNQRSKLQKARKQNPQLAGNINELNLKIKALEDDQKTSLKGIKNLELIKIFSDYCNNIFPNSTLIRIKKGLVIARKNWFRNSGEQISLLTESNRKIVVFGIVSSVKEKTYQEVSLVDFRPDQLNIIPSLINDITLSSFNIMQKEDRFIKPIAIFFE